MVTEVVSLPCPSSLSPQQFSGLATPPSLLVEDSMLGCRPKRLKCRHTSPAMPPTGCTFSQARWAGVGHVLKQQQGLSEPMSKSLSLPVRLGAGVVDTRATQLYSKVTLPFVFVRCPETFQLFSHRKILILYLVLTFRALPLAFFSGLALTERNKAKASYRAEKHFTKRVLMKSAP